MKTLRSGAFLILATLGIASLQAQTADDIVNKYVTAIGGKDVLNSVKSIYIESTMQAGPNSASSTTTILNGKGARSDVDFGGTKIVQCVNDKGGWVINPMMGASTATAMPAEQWKASQLLMYVGGPLYDYAAKGSKVELLGKDTATGASVYKLKVTTKDGVVLNFYIDASTYYIRKVSNQFNAGGQSVQVSSTFSDYRKLDNGYVMAYMQEQVLPQVTLDIATKKVELNKPVDPAIFELPKQ